MALDLGKQVGPLPLGAWAAIVGGGLAIAWYTRGTTTADPEPQRDTSSDPGVGEGPGGEFVNVTPPPSNTTNTGNVEPADNQAWAVYVMRELIARFNYDPLLVDSAIRKYITGARLSASEYVIVRQALLIKVPPDPLPADENTTPPPATNPIPNPPSSVPGPVRPPRPIVTRPRPKPQPKPAARYYTVKKGDTLWGISKRYYGTGVQWPRIFNANIKNRRLPDGSKGRISNPNLIQPGWRLHIP